MQLLQKLLSLIASGQIQQVPYYKDSKVTLNVFDNPTSTKYYNNGFVRKNAIALKAIQYPNGLGCTFALSQDSRTIRGLCSDKVQREYLVNTLRKPTIPSAEAMDFDQDGNLAVVDGRFCYLFTLSSDKKQATQVRSFMIPIPGDVSSVLFLDDTSASGIKYQRIAFASSEGYVGLFGMDGKRDTVWRLPQNPMDGKLYSLFGDGHATNGIFDFYGTGFRGTSKMGWWTLLWNSNLRTLSVTNITPMVLDSTSGLLVNATNQFPWKNHPVSLVPFYHGLPSDPTILALVNQGDIYEFTSNGVYVSCPLKQDTVINGDVEPIKSSPWLLIGHPPKLASCNTRNNWQQCLDLVASGDFSKTGQGLMRFTYTPDNYSSFIPINLYCLRADHPGDDVTKPNIGLQNTSYFDPIVGPKIRIFGSRQEMPSQQIQADLYYSSIPGVQLSTGYLTANPNIWYVDIAFPTNITLDPGDSLSSNNLQIGLHFQGYYPGVWEATNDWSFNGPTSLRGAVYAWDSIKQTYSLVAGSVPDPSVAPLPVQHPSSAVLSMSTSQWGVQSGNAALQAEDSGLLAILQGYSVVTSQPMDPSTINFASGIVSIQYELLSPLPNPWWPGSLDLTFNSPMNGLYNQYVGHVNIASTVNQVITTQFPLPSGLVGRTWNASDFQILFALNGPQGARIVIRSINFQ